MANVVITGPILDSFGQPANGYLYGEQTARQEIDGALITTVRVKSRVIDGVPFLDDGVTPLVAPSTPAGEAMTWVEDFRNYDKQIIRATIVPTAGPVAYAALVDVVQPITTTTYIVPGWSRDIAGIGDEVNAALTIVNYAIDNISTIVSTEISDQDIPGQAGAAVTSKVTGLDLVEASDVRVPKRNIDSSLLWTARTPDGRPIWSSAGPDGGPAPFARAVIAKQSGHVLTRDNYSGTMDASRRGDEATTGPDGKIPSATLKRYAMRQVPVWAKRGREIHVSTAAELEAAFVTIEADAGNGWWYDVLLAPGTYNMRERIIPTRTRLISVVRHAANIRLDNPDTVSVAVANAESPVWPIWDVDLVGCMFSVHNGRYSAHHDQDAANRDTQQRTIDCLFVHEGNTVAGAWSNPPAWGSGTASGLENYHYRSTFRSGGWAFAVHSNRPFDRPSITRLDECVLEPGGPVALLVASLGSQTTDRLELVNCRIGGHYIQHDASPWRATDGSSAHVEFAISLIGCDVMGWLDTSGGSPDYYPSQPDKELSATASGAVTKWDALVFDASRGVVKTAPTTATAEQFVGIALNDAASGARVRVLREAKLFPTQTRGGVTSWAFDAPVYLSTITPGALAASGTARVGSGVGAANIIHLKGRN
jgi:hypothetical protein